MGTLGLEWDGPSEGACSACRRSQPCPNRRAKPREGCMASKERRGNAFCRTSQARCGETVAPLERDVYEGDDGRREWLAIGARCSAGRGRDPWLSRLRTPFGACCAAVYVKTSLSRRATPFQPTPAGDSRSVERCSDYSCAFGGSFTGMSRLTDLNRCQIGHRRLRLSAAAVQNDRRATCQPRQKTRLPR
jgi:hypothetical protein